ncbi:formylglycine-generating enzyme family protein [Algoriphagus boritolerans]|uniref:Formylglycine-generating enzyme, required for sulfatase activity, contains SUMF1/FGE domain n=1 Tax=Algoriphagus boritolerans DSM 17298 = JCM 18970 TaxID=1120964 RepID=A0A1H5YXE8_9BACT|nr:SUMF1/EgtB/PvdO family nonheme iron enzyme [Algoriphagus boritolerans]SEG28704.1 Formylglycine-generating enzyme, required for sulfatase activity, contains SUMF1/FGE domain [Algoriphagus boritolerans DSM 17298 = JCM 18970]
MKKYLAASGLLLMSFQLNQEVVFEPYTQKIPGTEVTFDLTPIPAGSFMMGSNDPAFPDQNPGHEVAVDAFWMGVHEVTWDAFELFLDKHYEESMTEGGLDERVDGLTRPSLPYLDMTFGMGKEGKPAVGMTQYGALQFCHWLYLKTGMFYRLPTEAEWEYAARAGSKERFFFGRDASKLSEYAWTHANSQGSTQPVGQKTPNPWGLYDIYGNVQEWTMDLYEPDYYARSEKDNPFNPAYKLYPHAVRGGSFKTTEDQIGSAFRSSSDPAWKRIDPQIPKSQWWFPEAPFIGLRIVRPFISPSPEEIQAYYNQEPIADY